MSAPELTLLLGPQTRLGQALNAVIREYRQELLALGVTAYPSRVGDKALRDLMSGGDRDAIADDLELGRTAPILLASTKGLAAPAGTFRSRELLPDAEVFLQHWAHLIADTPTRIVVTIDPLPHFLFTVNHAAANAAIASMAWDAVYELSWSDVLNEVALAVPHASVVAVTTRRGFVAAETVAPLVFGAGAEAASANVLRRAILNAPEHELSGRPSALADLFDRDCPGPDATWLKKELGLDNVTTALLYDRFREDLEILRHMPNIHLI